MNILNIIYTEHTEHNILQPSRNIFVWRLKTCKNLHNPRCIRSYYTKLKAIRCLTCTWGTHCYRAAPESCWTCVSPWHNTRSRCCPGHSSVVALGPVPQSAPWCCCKAPAPGTAPERVREPAADSWGAACSGSDLGSPPRVFSLCGQCPRWCKWTARRSWLRCLGGGKTKVLCPDAWFSLVKNDRAEIPVLVRFKIRAGDLIKYTSKRKTTKATVIKVNSRRTRESFVVQIPHEIPSCELELSI